MPENYNGINIKKVDMTDENNKYLNDTIVNQNGEPLIEGYPTILFENKPNNYIEYSGPRNKDHIFEFIKNNK